MKVWSAIILFIALGQPATQPSAKDVEHAQRFEAEIAAFEKTDRENPPPKAPILFVGSSSIRMWTTAEAFRDLPVINRGFGGSQVSDAVVFAPRIVLPYRPKIIVFYSGDNDINDGESPEQVAADLAAFFNLVRRDLPDTKVVVIGIKPSISRWKLIEPMREANRRFQKLVQADRDAVFIDVEPHMLAPNQEPDPSLFLADGLHLSEKGYAVWNELIRAHLK